MSEWEERINSILGDPEQMSRISALAQSLMGGQEQAAPPSMDEGGLPDLSALAGNLLGGGGDGPDAAMLGTLGRLLRSGAGGDSRQRALLEAIKPYLSERRRSKMDRAMRLAHMAKLAQLALGEAGGKQDV